MFLIKIKNAVRFPFVILIHIDRVNLVLNAADG